LAVGVEAGRVDDGGADPVGRGSGSDGAEVLAARSMAALAVDALGQVGGKQGFAAAGVGAGVELGVGL